MSSLKNIIDKFDFEIKVEGKVTAMKIPFSSSDMTEIEAQGASEIIWSGWIITEPRTKELERRMAEYCYIQKAGVLKVCNRCGRIKSSHTWYRSW